MFLTSLLLTCVTGYTTSAREATPSDAEDLAVSYSYAVVMGTAGISAQRIWRNMDDSEFRWGVAGRIVGEYQTQSYESVGFSLAETGIDYRLDAGFRLLEEKVNVGGYYLLQCYLPVWDVAETPNQDSDIHSLHEVGFSLGLKKPRKLFGFTIERVRVGYKTAQGFRGWTFGTTFPF